MSAPKIHLLVVPDPLTNYQDVVVRCGITLAHAEPKFMFAEGMHLQFRLTGVCSKCLKPALTASDGYLYGLVEGQEEMAASA